MDTMANWTDELDRLIGRIESNAHDIRSYCRRHANKEDHSATNSPDLFSKRAPREIRSARRALLDSAVKLEHLCTDPTEFLEHHAIHVSRTCHHGSSKGMPWANHKIFVPYVVSTARLSPLAGQSSNSGACSVKWPHILLSPFGEVEAPRTTAERCNPNGYYW